MTTPLKFDDSNIQDEEARFDALIDWHHNLGHDHGLLTFWSIFSVRNMMEVPFPAVRKMRYVTGPSGWSDNAEMPVPENATWLDLWKVANALILTSKDHHHLFIEKFQLDGDDTLIVCTGS